MTNISRKKIAYWAKYEDSFYIGWDLVTVAGPTCCCVSFEKATETYYILINGWAFDEQQDHLAKLPRDADPRQYVETFLNERVTFKIFSNLSVMVMQ